MRASKILLSLFAIQALSACAVKFPDVKTCTVAGVILAGADCDYTGHAEPSEMGMEAFINWLEDEQALCVSSKDYVRQKSAAEQACTKLGPSCSYEVRKSLEEMSGRIDKIQKKSQDNK